LKGGCEMNAAKANIVPKPQIGDMLLEFKVETTQGTMNFSSDFNRSWRCFSAILRASHLLVLRNL